MTESNVIRNHVYELMDYFSVPGKPVTENEFRAFWYSLTMEEQEYLRDVALHYEPYPTKTVPRDRGIPTQRG